MNFHKGFQRLLLISLVPVGLALYQNFEFTQASVFIIMYFIIGLQLIYLKRRLLIILLAIATAISALLGIWLGFTLTLFLLALLIFISLFFFMFWIYIGSRWVIKGFQE